MKRRQRIRRSIVIISFLLFPVVIYYLSPYIVFEGIFRGIANGSLVVFLMLFVTSLVSGRLFCGWLCPPGGMQECLSHAVNKKVKGGRRNIIKYVIWVLWISGIIAAFAIKGLPSKIDMLFMTTYGISIADAPSYIVYYTIVGLIAALSLAGGNRAFCHYVCWMAPFMVIGTKIKNFFNWPSVRLKYEREKCISCRLCNKSCPMSIDVEQMVKTGRADPECILCGECVDTCSKKVIGYTFKKTM